MIRLNKNLIRTIFFLLLILISFQPISYAQEYYADIDISVDNSGLVDITGISNYPNLIVENSQLYTYKKQDIWQLNITINEELSDYIYQLKLPDNANINNIISLTGFESIKEESGNLIITGSGTNEKLSIVVQYIIDGTIENANDYDNLILAFLFGLIIVLTILLLYYIYQEKKGLKNKGKIKEEVSEISLRGLTERQKEIVKLLIRTNRALTQKDIEKELNLPKAAVSRNVHSLEIKGLVEIEQTGMSNLVRLKKL